MAADTIHCLHSSDTSPMMNPDDWSAVVLTLRLASTTTLVLMALCLPLAWWLGRTRGLMRHVVNTLTTLPLVLPPAVLGFYLLVFTGPYGWVGQLTSAAGWGVLPFTFAGLVVGSCVYSLPFVLQPLQQAFAAISTTQLEAATSLGAGRVQTFVRVVLPQSMHGLLTALILGFAHTMGEFGVVLMMGGNIPGQTQVLSMVIYNHVEAMEYTHAHWLAGGMLVLACVLIGLMQLIAARRTARHAAAGAHAPRARSLS